MLNRLGRFEVLIGAEDEQDVVVDFDIEARMLEQ